MPVINEGGGKYDLVHDLEVCLRKIKTHPYFLVDVLCINQKNEEEKKKEIAKQAKIFEDAAGVVVYLWTLETADVLTTPLEGLKHLLSWALIFGDCPEQRSCFTKERGRAPTTGDTSFAQHFNALRTDYWFTSLWALQEIVLAPAGVWMTRHGDVCRLNGHILTTRVLAMIIRLLSWVEKRRSKYWLCAHGSFREREGMSEDDFETLLTRHKSLENGRKNRSAATFKITSPNTRTA